MRKKSGPKPAEFARGEGFQSAAVSRGAAPGWRPAPPLARRAATVPRLRAIFRVRAVRFQRTASSTTDDALPVRQQQLSGHGWVRQPRKNVSRVNAHSRPAFPSDLPPLLVTSLTSERIISPRQIRCSKITLSAAHKSGGIGLGLAMLTCLS